MELYIQLYEILIINTKKILIPINVRHICKILLLEKKELGVKFVNRLTIEGMNLN